MNALYSKYGVNGFTILAFPCNIFHLEEPGANGTEILNGIKYVRPGGGFTPTITMLQKLEVNGQNEHPLFTYLKSNCPPTATAFNQSVLFYTPIRAGDVAWNFEKFLVGKDGRVILRAHPSVEPELMVTHIETELARHL
ncbi:hypothetical protein Btru_059063 [Bulinus truncatus]|nr:hypothetical protein Btru_059063 [Bulinus truncatus]